MEPSATGLKLKKLPLLHRMEERAGERRDLGCPSPRSSPHSCVAGRGRKRELRTICARCENFQKVIQIECLLNTRTTRKGSGTFAFFWPVSRAKDRFGLASIPVHSMQRFARESDQF